MTTINVRKAKGYSGKMSRTSYVAEVENIRGDHVSRDFLRETSVDWGDSELYRKKKGIWTLIFELTRDGIYEVQEFGERYYLAIEDGQERKISLDEARAHFADQEA
jgi:hypothetical protein